MLPNYYQFILFSRVSAFDMLLNLLFAIVYNRGNIEESQ